MRKGGRVRGLGVVFLVGGVFVVDLRGGGGDFDGVKAAGAGGRKPEGREENLKPENGGNLGVNNGVAFGVEWGL